MEVCFMRGDFVPNRRAHSGWRVGLSNLKFTVIWSLVFLPFLPHIKYMQLYPFWNFSEPFTRRQAKTTPGYKFVHVQVEIPKTTKQYCVLSKNFFTEQLNSSNFSFHSKFLSSLLSAEGELLLDEARPGVLCDRQVWFPGKKNQNWCPIVSRKPKQ